MRSERVPDHRAVLQQLRQLAVELAGREGLVDAECVSDRGFNYLELTVNGDPDDPRVDDIGGDLSPQWGMHLIDANVERLAEVFAGFVRTGLDDRVRALAELRAQLRGDALAGQARDRATAPSRRPPSPRRSASRGSSPS